MLRKFLDGQRDAMDRVAQALACDDLPTAQRHAHTLKSVAGNLGASALQEAAGALEQACAHAARAQLPALQQRCADLLQPLVAALQEQLPQVEPAQGSGGHDRTRYADIRAQLDGLLAEDDMESVELFQQHAELLRQGLGDGYRALEQAMRAFDFEAALQALRQAADPEEL